MYFTNVFFSCTLNKNSERKPLPRSGFSNFKGRVSMEKCKKILKVIVQIIFIWGFLLLGTWVSNFFSIPLPGSIIGLVLLFICLKLHIIKLQWIDAGASFLTGELLLFFVPAAVGIVQYEDIFGIIGIKLIIVIICSTMVVMASTGWIAEKFAKGDVAK